MPKPSKLPEWASSGADTVEPSEAKKDAGWSPAENPPAEYFNWWMNNVYEWAQYLNAGSFDGNIEFNNTVEVENNLTIRDGILHFTHPGLGLPMSLAPASGNGVNSEAGTTAADCGSLGAPWSWTIAIPLPAGANIKRVDYTYTNSASSSTFSVQKVSLADGSSSSLFTHAAAGSSRVTQSVDSGDEIMDEDYLYALHISGSSGSLIWWNAKVYWDMTA